MRIATAYRYESAVDSLQRRQRELTEAQNAMTTGKRISVPSDDPVGAARAERAYIVQQRITSEQRAVQASRNAMTLADTALGQAGDVMQQARETLVAAGNGAYTAGERAAQAQHLRQVRDQLLGLANQGNGAGGYLFGGQDGGMAPFRDTAGGVVYGAAGGESMLSLSETLPSTVDGRSIWLAAPGTSPAWPRTSTIPMTNCGNTRKARKHACGTARACSRARSCTLTPSRNSRTAGTPMWCCPGRM